MDGLPALIEVAKAVAGAFAWIVTTISGAIVAVAWLVKYFHGQVVIAKDARIQDLEGRMSQTLADFEKRQRDGLEKAVEHEKRQRQKLEKALKTLEAARDEAEKNHLAWQEKYQEREAQLKVLYEKVGDLDPTLAINEILSEPESDIEVIDITIDFLETLKEEKDRALDDYYESMAADAAHDSMREEMLDR